MPIYEFVCGVCGSGFEKLCRLSDSEPPLCPRCGAKETRKMMSVISAPHAPGEKGGDAPPAPPTSRFT